MSKAPRNDWGGGIGASAGGTGTAAAFDDASHDALDHGVAVGFAVAAMCATAAVCAGMAGGPAASAGAAAAVSGGP